MIIGLLLPAPPTRNVLTTLWKIVTAHFIEMETQAPRGKAICSRSCSWLVTEQSEMPASCPHPIPPCSFLINPLRYNPQSSPVHGIFQARMLEWVAIFFSRGSFQLRDWTQCLLHWQVGSLPLSHQGSPNGKIKQTKMYFPLYLLQIELSLFQILSA